jgi:starvation-inducible DNA-binding protein
VPAPTRLPRTDSPPLPVPSRPTPPHPTAPQIKRPPPPPRGPPPSAIPYAAPSQAAPYPTENDLTLSRRQELNGLMNQRLADVVDLQLQMKQAHWNVKGPSFIGLHELFDKVEADVRGYADLIAERIVQLGGIAEGTARRVAARSRLPEYPLAISEGRSHVEAVACALSTFGQAARMSIDEATALDDADTADLFVEVSRGIDKWLWFVEAHSQATR